MRGLSVRPINLYIGYDPIEDIAYRVCRESVLARASVPVNIIRLNQDWLRRVGLYRRQFFVEDGQKFDTTDGTPFSTEFSFTRFLVPSLQPEGVAVFCDSDFLWRADIAELVGWFAPKFAVQVVKHDHHPQEETKMRGCVQSSYSRKNWSSLMLLNCDHPGVRGLTPYEVNHSGGRWLHGFKWLHDEEIGEVPAEWNWLEGSSSTKLDPKCVHFTRGTPDMPGWEEVAYAHEWMGVWQRLQTAE